MKVLTCIAFHFRQERLHYLRQVLFMQQFLADAVHVFITTNTADPEELRAITSIAPATTDRFKFEVVTFDNLPNPWLLTWAHKVILAAKLDDPSYTHYLYSEDDIEVTPMNIDYWINARETLRPLGLYPSFVRVEWSDDYQDWVSTDIRQAVSIETTPHVSLPGGSYGYINFPNPYQGLFFYDRELMAEHAGSISFDILRYGNLENLDLTWGGGVAERANFAQTFMNVPNGFFSRNVAPYLPKYMMLDPRCFVHHLPNNFANLKPEVEFGKLRVKDIFCH